MINCRHCGPNFIKLFGCVFLAVSFAGQVRAADTFLLPTANRTIYEKGHEDQFFVGTVGKPWMSGTFGCVRTDGSQIHEGLDIKCLQRDKKGEPTDPVNASADGTVAYVNTRPSLSNYGNYIILRHQIEGLDICTLYAHLSAVRPGLKAGQPVKAGETIATMGHTSNTRQRITLDRAHVHFEIDLLLNERYAAWHKTALAGERNDHGDWNGKNLAGLDPWAILLAQRKPQFSLLQFIRAQPELFRVIVRDTQFSWLKRYAPLIRPTPRTDKEGIAGYEISFNFNGVAIQLTPRAPSEITSKTKYQLIAVNDSEQKKDPCRHLVTKKGSQWELTSHGIELLNLLTY